MLSVCSSPNLPAECARGPRSVSSLFHAWCTRSGLSSINKVVVNRSASTCQTLLSLRLSTPTSFYKLKIAPFLPSFHFLVFFSLFLFSPPPGEPQIVSRFSHIVTLCLGAIWIWNNYRQTCIIPLFSLMALTMGDKKIKRFSFLLQVILECRLIF